MHSLIREICNLPTSLDDYWSIIDHYPNPESPELVMIHTTNDYDPFNPEHDPLRQVRGLVIDLVAKRIVAKPLGHTPILPLHEPLSLKQDKVQVPTLISKYQQGRVMQTVGIQTFDHPRLDLGYEGAILFIWKWHGKIFISSHRSIDGTKSHWGGRTPFYQLYQQMKGPAPESLFGPEEDSPYTYVFLVVHDEIRLASSNRENLVLYLETKECWKPPAAMSSKVPPCHHQKPCTLELANQFTFPRSFATRDPSLSTNELKVVYKDDEAQKIYYGPGKNRDVRLQGGDFVLLTDQQGFIWRLESPGYQYRAQVMGNDPNYYHQFVAKMPFFTRAYPQEILSQYPRYFWNGEELRLETPTQRQVYWWTLFYDAVPPYLKKDVEEYLKKYHKEIHQVARWVLTQTLTEEEQRFFPEKIRERIQQLKDAAKMGYRKEIHENLVNLLYKETGTTFYKLKRCIEKLENFRKKK